MLKENYKRIFTSVFKFIFLISITFIHCSSRSFLRIHPPPNWSLSIIKNEDKGTFKCELKSSSIHSCGCPERLFCCFDTNIIKIHDCTIYPRKQGQTKINILLEDSILQYKITVKKNDTVFTITLNKIGNKSYNSSDLKPASPCDIKDALLCDDRLSKVDKKCLMHTTIAVGMSREMLYFLYGEPRRSDKNVIDGIMYDKWVYKKINIDNRKHRYAEVLIDSLGIVTSYELK
jgi:hypothetical protein